MSIIAIMAWVLLVSVGHAASRTAPEIGDSPRSSQLPDTHALIVNSGSTNTCPYTIDVALNSFATYTVCQRHGSGTLDVPQTISFFDHVLKATPLDHLPYKPCLKPISYATETTVDYAQQKSPDISCPSHDSRVTQLYDDAVSIQHALGFSTIRRPQSLPLKTVEIPDARNMVAPRYGKQTFAPHPLPRTITSPYGRGAFWA
ncbi:hypothetical protein [Dictyobacter aurantiacus]|uniref:Uncharacterized protein n=1 Tax=Dictyobacter aurantiacus TaxID=1936993 RepID=A0A401ZJG2_9CHLR|nr:hypothetical protein [Dictyobacter aurantiacus]GCE06964.1 hypothetical protein KDAU_42930 [Dictyobacter aurantiacus]